MKVFDKGSPRLKLAKDEEFGSGCWIDDETGELKCVLEDTTNPNVKFVVEVNFDSTNELRISRITPIGAEGVPTDLIDEIKKVITEVARERIPIEEVE